MSYLVLHMDKFKKEAIRGIQSHNRRERESHSNPDIDYDRSAANYELHEAASSNYAEAIQNRIDDLLLVKAVRAVVARARTARRFAWLPQSPEPACCEYSPVRSEPQRKAPVRQDRQ